MNCNCVQEIEKGILKRKTWKNKPIERTEFISGILTFGKNGFKTSSEVEISITGQKKKEIVNITHTYCPFCGKKATKN